MPRGSRSSRKQPDFDPSELDDLIFSPAVGTGVGSHLMERTPPFPAPTSGMSRLGDAPDSTRSRSATPTIVVIPNKSTVATETTVDTLNETTVDDTSTSTVEERNRITAKLEDDSIYGPASPTAVSDMATVDTSDMTTVVTHDRSTVVPHKDATVDTPDTTTVDMSTDIEQVPCKGDDCCRGHNQGGHCG